VATIEKAQKPVAAQGERIERETYAQTWFLSFSKLIFVVDVWNSLGVLQELLEKHCKSIDLLLQPFSSYMHGGSLRGFQMFCK